MPWIYPSLLALVCISTLSSPIFANRLRVAVQADAKTLDPHIASDAASMRYLENISCGLLRYDRSYGSWQLDLAKSLNPSADGLSYDITLRDAYFHNGRPITSRDVMRSIERIRTKAVRASHFERMVAIDIIDSHRLRLRLDHPFPPFLLFLAHPMNAVVDVDAIDSPEKNSEPMQFGCGPFRPVAWQRQQSFQMTRFQQHFRFQTSQPYVESIRFVPIADSGTRTSALRSGAVDLVLDVPLKDIHALQSTKGIVLKRSVGSFWEYLGLQNQRPYLSDSRVRRALAWAIDRQQLNKIVKFGMAEPLLAGPISASHWAGLKKPIYGKAQPQKARHLLQEAGFDFNHRFEILVGSEFPYQVDAAIVIKQQLRAIGVKTRIQSLESGLFFYRLNQQDFDMAIVGWLGFVDPDEWFYEIFRSEGAWNQQSYKNQTFDQLIEKARTANDRQQRQQLYWQAQKLLADDAPMIFLYMNPNIAAYQDWVKGFELHATGQTRALETTWIETDEEGL